ncbi:winged helix-turn-helix domain-containing protein [Halorubrum halodurans]|uniref:Transcriptional regulator n=1 Tax=Halorubrum halodurans TaxID=1383851 RepID=A0A256IQ36_9EURY|nr:winged helix-turn-helix domain-containing protein [Halorubrum halodurans]OYR58406.1 transcriptional regulator [Halorubrum halodurans]
MAVRHRSRGDQTDEPTEEPSTGKLLDLFGDEYTRRVFEAVSEQPRGGRAVAQAADVSRPTAYRRLNELQEAGLVTSECYVSPDGHHRERFAASARHLSVSLDDGDIEATVDLGC